MITIQIRNADEITANIMAHTERHCEQYTLAHVCVHVYYMYCVHVKIYVRVCVYAWSVQIKNFLHARLSCSLHSLQAQLYG